MKIYLAFIVLLAFILLEGCVATKVNNGSPHAVSPRKFQFHRQSLLKPTPDQKQIVTPTETEEAENSLPKAEADDNFDETTPDNNYLENDDAGEGATNGEVIKKQEAQVEPAQIARKKIFVVVGRLNNTPASLKDLTVKQVLRQNAPEKYSYTYKYVYKGNLKTAKEFSYDEYLLEKGQPNGKYVGDAVVIAHDKELIIFSDSLPDDNWFDFKLLEE